MATVLIEIPPRSAYVGVVRLAIASLARAAEFAEAIQKGRGRMPAFPMITDADIAGVLGRLEYPQFLYGEPAVLPELAEIALERSSCFGHGY
jgi:hypothetical protein